MRDAIQLMGQRAAAEYLRQLLLKPGPYRDAWQRLSTRPRLGVINQLAVAEVIVGQHHVPGQFGQSKVLPYQLRDVVAGALSGALLSEDTLQMFIRAFGFSEEESDRLKRLLAGSSRISVMSGTSATSMGVALEVDAAIGERKHHTVALHDHVWVTADGRIDRARYMHVIQAISAAVDRIPFMIDTNILTLEVGQGCKKLTGHVRRVGTDLFATDIVLARTLGMGETLTLQYWLSYRCSDDHEDRANREHRRGVMRRCDNLDMRVEFHPDKLPGRIWWAHWDGINDTILEQELVTLDSQFSVHRYVRSLEKTVVGFYWQWDDGEQGR